MFSKGVQNLHRCELFYIFHEFPQNLNPALNLNPAPPVMLNKYYRIEKYSVIIIINDSPTDTPLSKELTKVGRDAIIAALCSQYVLHVTRSTEL